MVRKKLNLPESNWHSSAYSAINSIFKNDKDPHCSQGNLIVSHSLTSLKKAWNCNIEMLGQSIERCSSCNMVVTGGSSEGSRISCIFYVSFLDLSIPVLTLSAEEPGMSSCFVHWFWFVCGIFRQVWRLFFLKAIGSEMVAVVWYKSTVPV